MKRNELLCIFLAVVLIAPGIAWSQAKVGTTGVNFLKIGPSSRAVAMADAFLPIADDVSALWYNPAGMVNMRNNEMLVSHVSYPADISYDFIGYAQPLPALGAAMGVQVFGLYTGDMDETTPERPYGTGRTFTASDFSAGVSYAQRLTNKFSVGFTGKYIQENLANEVARGYGIDVGTFYDTGWKSIKIAMLISNFGPDMDFISSAFPLPMIFKFGTSADLKKTDITRLTMVLEFLHPNDNVEELHLGFEYAFKESAFLRAGKKFNGFKRDTYDEYLDDIEGKNPYVEYPIIDEDGMISFDGLSFGGGLYFRGIGLSVDYSYANIGYVGDIHRFSLAYRFGR